MNTKFYVVLIVTFTDGTADKVAIYTYGSEEEALKNFYSYMGQYVNGTNVATVCAEAKDNIGTIYKNESWNKSEE